MGHSFSLIFFFSTLYINNADYKIWPMTDFELWTLDSNCSDIGSNRSANWAPTAAP